MRSVGWRVFRLNPSTSRRFQVCQRCLAPNRQQAGGSLETMPLLGRQCCSGVSSASRILAARAAESTPATLLANKAVKKENSAAPLFLIATRSVMLVPQSIHGAGPKVGARGRWASATSLSRPRPMSARVTRMAASRALDGIARTSISTVVRSTSNGPFRHTMAQPGSRLHSAPALANATSRRYTCLSWARSVHSSGHALRRSWTCFFGTGDHVGVLVGARIVGWRR